MFASQLPPYRHELFFCVTGVMNDEFIVFNPNQILPTYIIYFGSQSNQSSEFLKTLQNKINPNAVGFSKWNVLPSRNIDSQKPEDIEYLMVEGHFSRMLQKHPMAGQRGRAITSIDFVYNAELQKKFDGKKAEFNQKKIPDKVVFAYHGTPPANIDSILKSNLNTRSREVHGKGYYFSE